MSNLCPSCSAPLDPAATILKRSGTTGITSRCGKCGYVLPELPNSARDEATCGESLPVGFGDTDVSRSGDKAADADSPTLIPESPSGTRRIGHFELIRVLGRGAFGAVWLAKDLNLGRQVALKLPTRSEKDSGLLREAQTAAKLTHPNIVSVFEVGTVSGQVFIACEFVDGCTLRDELHEERPKPERAVDVMATIARAAHYAHENNVVHRDMKPANVMVDKQGTPYITDFGIAKSIAEDETISLDGEVVGTIAYMAPEQAKGKNQQTDRRADVYAMGVMLFELLTESRPFRGSAQGVLHQKTIEDAPSPRTLVPTLNRDLETICLKCLERDPDKRYQTALQLADELERYQQNLPIHARPVSSLEKAWRWCCRNRTVSGALTFSFAVLMIGLATVSHFWRDAVHSEHRTQETLYRAHMNLAMSKMYSGEVIAARQILSRYSGELQFDDFVARHLASISRQFVQIVDHGARVVDVAVSHDGSMFATVSKSDLRVWNSANGTMTRALESSSYEFESVEYSPADDRLLTACSDGIARVWNPSAHGRTIIELDHGSGMRCAVFSPHREWIVTGGDDGRVKVWQLSTGQLVTDELSATGQSIYDIAFSADSSLMGILAAQGTSPKDRTRRRVRIARTDSFEVTVETPDISVGASMVFDAAQESVVVASQNGRLIRYRCLDGKPTTAISTANVAYGQISPFPGTDLLVLTVLDGTTFFLDKDLSVVRQLATHNKSFGVIDVSRDGRFMVVGSGDGSARLINPRGTLQQETVWLDGPVRGLAFTNDSRTAIMACSDGTVRRWDTDKSPEVICGDDRGRALRGLAIDATTGHLAACGMMRELRIADPTTMSVVAETTLPFGGYSGVAWSTDGRYLSVGSRSGEVLTFESADLSNSVSVFSQPEGIVNAIGFVDSHVVATAWNNRQVLLIDVATGKVVSELATLDSAPLSLACDQKNRLLVVGTQTGALHLYSLADRTEKSTFRAHAGLVSAVAIFPDGKQLVSGGLDGALRIWDIASGELVGQLPGHGKHRTFAVAVSPDGNTIASSGLEGDVRIWSGSASSDIRSSGSSFGLHGGAMP